MADHTPYQKGIIKRFYDNRDTIALQKLSEIVSDLYLETKDAAINRKWKAAHTQMLAVGVHQHQADNITQDRDLGALAKIVSERA